MSDLLALMDASGIETAVTGVLTVGVSVALSFLAYKFIRKGTGKM